MLTLLVALSLPKYLPPVQIQSRWYSESIRIFTIGQDSFSKNAKGYPVLSRAHQSLINRFIRLRTIPWFILCDVGPVPVLNASATNVGIPATDSTHFPTLSEAKSTPPLKDPAPHLSYMRNLQMKQPTLDAVDRFAAGYQDYLQAPLQPLTVNLESITYEVFEKDPIKYAWYERAIARALHDWVESGKPTSNPDGRVVVAVVGAGRGPLVTRALQAAADVGVEIDMWALEKNPNAFVLLQRNNEQIWNGKVQLVKSDMRTWRGPVRREDASQIHRSYNVVPEEETSVSPSATFTGSPATDATYLLATATHTPTHYKIDILISELLGSFADNELSPECLDGVQHLLNPVHGISIPASYTAHLTPVAAPKLHADILHTMTSNNPTAAEVPYVVMFNAIDHLSTAQPVKDSSSKPSSPATYATVHQMSTPPPTAGVPTPPEPVIGTTWSFQHPNPALPSALSVEDGLSNAHNARHSTLIFPIPNRSTCHGLAGYFESVLYAGVELSTNPATMDSKSEGMISWFPIYFPLKVCSHCFGTLVLHPSFGCSC